MMPASASITRFASRWPREVEGEVFVFGGERSEEGKTLNVVDVEVAKENVSPDS